MLAIKRERTVVARRLRHRVRRAMVEQLERREMMAVNVLEDKTYTFAVSDFPAFDGSNQPMQSIYIFDSYPLQGNLKVNGQTVGDGTTVTRSQIQSGQLTFTPDANYPFDMQLAATQFYYFVNADYFNGNYGAYQQFQFVVINVNDKPITQDSIMTIQENESRPFSQSDFYIDDGDSFYSGSGYGSGTLQSVIITTLPDSRLGRLTYNNLPVTVNQEIPAASLSNLVFQHLDYVNPTTTNTNRKHWIDVNADGQINVTDELEVINALNRMAAGQPAGPYYYDVTQDGYTSPIDALYVHDWLQVYGPVFVGFRFAVKDTWGTANQGIDTSDTKAFGFNIYEVNDPPVGSNVTRVIAEDSAAYVFTANDFPYSDPKDWPANPFDGVQIVTLPTSGSLTLQGNGLMAGQTLSLAQLSSLRYTPATNFSGTATFKFRVFDNTYLNMYDYMGIDQVHRTFTFSITPVNDAPTITNGVVYTFPSTLEDTNSTSRTVAQILAASGYADVDSGALRGLAITNMTGVGVWQYSTNGTVWTNFGTTASGTTTLSDTNAMLLGDGTQIRFVPAANQSGTANFRFRAWDQTFGVASINGSPTYASTTPSGGTTSFSTSSGTASITVTAVNDAPTITNGYQYSIPNTLEDTTSAESIVYSILMASGYSEVDLGAQRAMAIVGASGPGQWSYLVGGGVWTAFGDVSMTKALLLPESVGIYSTIIRFVPSANQSGQATFQYKAWDRTTGVASGSNQPSYALNPTFGGSSAFSSGTGTAVLNILPVNDAPVPANTTISLPEDTTRAFVLANFNYNDVENNPLQAVMVQAPALGELRMGTTLIGPGSWVTATVADLAAQQLTFRPILNGNGSPYTTINFRVSDGDWSSGSAVMSVTVTPVNDAPSTADVFLQTNEDAPFYFNPAGLPFYDPDNDPFVSVVVVTQPTNGQLISSAGVVAANTRLTMAQWQQTRFVPVANANGNPYATFSFRVSDGTLDSNTSTATMRVLPANDAPVGVDRTVSILEDTVYTFSLSDFPMTDPADTPANSLLSVEVIAPPLASEGKLTVFGNDLVTSPSLRNIPLNYFTQGGVRFTPAANRNGNNLGRFTFKVHDDGGTANGGIDTDTVARTFSFNIQPVVDPVIAANDNYTTRVGGQLTVSAPGVLLNDSNPDFLPASVVLVTDVARGTLQLSSDGGFVYTSSTTIAGPVTFTYQVNYGSGVSNLATVTINVNNNTAPVAVNDTYSGLEDYLVQISNPPGVLGNDTDADGDTLTTILVSQPAHGYVSLWGNGQFTYSPNANFYGTDTFTYRVTDGLLTSNVATVTINLQPTYDPPFPRPDVYSANAGQALNVPASSGVIVNDDNPDNRTLTAILVPNSYGNAFVSLAADGSFSYFLPGAVQGSIGSFSYYLTDGITNSIATTVQINYTRPNVAPVALPETYSVEVGQTLIVTAANSLLVNDTDADGDPLTVSLVAGPTKGTFLPPGLNANGTFSYVPNSTLVATTDTFTYRAFDGLAFSNVVTVTINITPKNDAPIAVDDPTSADVGRYRTDEDVTLNVSAAFGLLKNDSDPEGQPITVFSNTQPVDSANAPAGTVQVNADGSFIYTPALNFSGVARFTYRITDGVKTSNIATVTLNVSPINDAPVVAGGTINIPDALEYTFTIGNFGYSDPDGDPMSSLTFTALPLVADGQILLKDAGGNATAVSINQVIPAASIAAGRLSFLPTLSGSKQTTISYLASDGQLNSNVTTATIRQISGRDIERTFGLLPIPSVSHNSTTVIDPRIELTAVDGSPLIVTVESSPGVYLKVGESKQLTYGKLTVQANGSLLYQPDADLLTRTVNPLQPETAPQDPLGGPALYRVRASDTLELR